MNGRVYDPTIARFLSADPIIQAPSHLQSYNRYSYVMNNPLKYVDPSGYSWWSKNVTDKFRSFRRNVSNAWRENYKTIIAVALAAWGGWAAYGSVMNSALAVGPLSKGAYFAASFKAGAAAGAASGAIMGSSLTAMNGGNLRQIIKSGIKGGATGALSGGMFGGAGAYSGNWFNKATLHGLAGGTSSEITGGRFKDGFRLSFGVTALTTAAVYMRDVMVQQSKIDPRNASGESVGFKGDKFKLGGGRFNPARGSLQDQIPSPLGGLQGGQGRLGIPFTDIAFNYAPGSLQDRLVEAYAGPHDWLNSGFWYNPATGNIKSGISTIGSAFGEAMNLANVAVATPFVAASVYPQNLHYLYEAANDDRF